MGKNAKLRDIVVLGLLHEQPRYGYEVKMIIDHVMSHFLDVSSGSLYYGLKKLQQEGFIEETTIEKVGRRPERSVYEITPTGRAMLEEHLPSYIFPNVKAFFPINVALFFLDAVSPIERVRRLKMWRERLKRSESTVTSIAAKYAESASWSHIMILKHQLHYIRSEFEFVDKLLSELPDGITYELDPADLEEVNAEMEAVIQQFDYGIYQQTFNDSFEMTKE